MTNARVCLLVSAALIVSRVFVIVDLMSALRGASNPDCMCIMFDIRTFKYNSTVINVMLPSVSAHTGVYTQHRMSQHRPPMLLHMSPSDTRDLNDIHWPKYDAAMTDLKNEVLHFHLSFEIPMWQYGTPTSVPAVTLTHATAKEDWWVGKMTVP